MGYLFGVLSGFKLTTGGVKCCGSCFADGATQNHIDPIEELSENWCLVFCLNCDSLFYVILTDHIRYSKVKLMNSKRKIDFCPMHLIFDILEF